MIAHQARFDLLAFVRDRQARFFTLVLPLLFLVMFVSVFGNDTVGPGHVKATTYYVPGLAALAVIASSFVNLVIALTAQRENGILKRRRTTPVPAGTIIAGRTLTTTGVSLVVVTVLLLIGRLAYGVRVPAAAVPAIAVTAVAGAITFCVVGYAVSSVIGSADAAQPVVQAITLPLYFVSGVFIPDPNLPAWMRHVADAFPVAHLVHALRHSLDPAVHGSGLDGADLAVLAVWAAGGLLFALRRFSWTPTARTA